MVDPLFWLGLSLLLVAISLMTVLLVAVPALRELARAARSAEKLFDTLNRDLPPTLEAIRLTGLEISGLTDDVSEGVQQAGRVVQQVDQGLSTAVTQAKHLQVGGQSLLAGLTAALTAWSRPAPRAKAARSAGSPSSRSQELRLRKPKHNPQSGAPTASKRDELRSASGRSARAESPHASQAGRAKAFPSPQQRPVPPQKEPSNGLSAQSPANAEPPEASPTDKSASENPWPSPLSPLQEPRDD